MILNSLFVGGLRPQPTPDLQDFEAISLPSSSWSVFEMFLYQDSLPTDIFKNTSQG